MRHLVRGPQFTRFWTRRFLLVTPVKRIDTYYNVGVWHMGGCACVYYRSYRNCLAQRGRTPYPVCDGLWQKEGYIQTRGYCCAHEQFQTERRLPKQHATVTRPWRRFHRRHILKIKCIIM